MQKWVFLAALTVVSCQLFKKSEKRSDFELFKSYIQGDFDNSAQIAAERARGRQIHPYARHVNRLADHKILNKPLQYNGFYLLEESYYEYPDSPRQIKPFLFWFERTNMGQVKLHSLALPKHIEPAALRNDNLNLVFDYNELAESATFVPTEYKRIDNYFYLKVVVELPNNTRFTLEETIERDQLTVMERFEKGGKLITPYTTPIVYKRTELKKVK